MRNCLVFMPSGEQKIAREFPRANHRLGDGLWAIGSASGSCADVCDILEIGSGHPGVAMAMDEYYGHFDQALWQKLDAWSRKS